MHMTHQIQQRMAQRNFTPVMLDAILTLGEWNDRGDQLCINHKQYEALQEQITQARRAEKQIHRYIKHLERLKNKNKATLVLENNTLITVY